MEERQGNKNHWNEYRVKKKKKKKTEKKWDENVKGNEQKDIKLFKKNDGEGV